MHPQAPGHVNQLLSQELSTLVQSEIENLNRTSSAAGPSTSRQPSKAGTRKWRTSAERPRRRSSTAGWNSGEAPQGEEADGGAGGGEGGTAAGRGGKVYVLKACVACKSSHVACDVNRPCGRCLRLGKPEQCVDAERKKRGRPPTQFSTSSSSSVGPSSSARRVASSSGAEEEMTGRSESEEPIPDHRIQRMLSEQIDLRQHEAGGYPAPTSPPSSSPPPAAPTAAAAAAVFDGPAAEERGGADAEDPLPLPLPLPPPSPPPGADVEPVPPGDLWPSAEFS